MKLGRGFWLNPDNFRYLEVQRHEISAKDPAALKKLGYGKPVIQAMELSGDDEDAIRLRLLRFGAVRLRDYHDGLHVQFYKARGEVRGALEAVQFMHAEDKRSKGKKSGISQAWTINIENMHPAARDHVVLDMPRFIAHMDDGKTVMKEAKAKNAK